MKSPVTFPRIFEGQRMGCPDVMRATGMSRYDVLKAFELDPSIATTAALKAAVVTLKSRPARGKPTLKRSSLLWNGTDRPRSRARQS